MDILIDKNNNTFDVTPILQFAKKKLFYPFFQ